MMRIIHVGDRILSVVVLAIGVSLASPSAAQSPLHVCEQCPPVPPEDKETFKCNQGNSRTQTNEDPSSKHTVTLSWTASLSLTTPPADGDGYNLYRLNPVDCSCTKVLNQDGLDSLIRKTVDVDKFVELGKTYCYAVRAFKENKRNKESQPSNKENKKDKDSHLSNVVEVSIPHT